ncbi:MAG: AMMECR1 domain-containing protein [Acidobacteria bacterium]|nr:MAG: AMMECR1 domain-containing protein [Acidobacteriota bacterium]
MLNREQRSRLLQIARDSIAAAFAKQTLDLDDEAFDEDLRRPAGAFVTLTIRGDLRGCIGSIAPVAPLFRAVANGALNAAFRDPRFPPLRKDEFERTEIEISVMGPIEIVNDVNEIVAGRDGLIVSRGRNAGLLLPQVASEYGWDRDTFLGQTCRKAGLPSDAWRLPDCRIERFAAEVFSEQTTE